MPYPCSLPMLVADVGGTNVRFGLAVTDRHPPLLAESIRPYRVADFDSFNEAATCYLGEIGEGVKRAVFGIAGPIKNGVVQATNSRWRINAADTQRALTLRSVRLVNDFVAMSMSPPLLNCDQVEVIGAPPLPAIGAAASQTFAVVGPGTGLGVAGLQLRAGRFNPLQTEGGHSGFAPGTVGEREVLAHLAARFDHVSNERVVSGQGLVNLHRALTEMDGGETEELSPEDITARAETGEDEACRDAVEMFCAVFGAIAGDVALTLGAWDGVYLGGGLPSRLLPWIKRGEFRRRFENKGRLGNIMRRIPTLVITYNEAGLLGAAGIAMADAGSPLLAAPS